MICDIRHDAMLDCIHDDMLLSFEKPAAQCEIGKNKYQVEIKGVWKKQAPN